MIDDPGARSEGQQLAEHICQENNKYLIDLEDDFGEPLFQPTAGGVE